MKRQFRQIKRGGRIARQLGKGTIQVHNSIVSLKHCPRRRQPAIHVERLMELSVQNLYGLLIRSRLLPLDDAKKMYDRWMSEANDAADVGRFAKWMVANNYVTEYQAGLLARGHADHFFLDKYKVLDR